MKKQTKLLLALTLALSIMLFTGTSVGAKTVAVDKDNFSLSNAQNHAILYTTLDNSGRPTQSGWIGSDKDEEGQRVGSPAEPANISNWRSFQQYIQFDGKKHTLWDRGHLIGNQFAGEASNVAANIVSETFYMNQRLMTYFEGGMSKSSENALDNWLYLHPNYKLEYYVTANYNNNTDLVPSSVTLKYRGLDKSGSPIQIKLPDPNTEGVSPQKTSNDMFTTVTINNIIPGMTIDYATGKIADEHSSSSAKTSIVDNFNNISKEKSSTLEKVKSFFLSHKEVILSVGALVLSYIVVRIKHKRKRK